MKLTYFQLENHLAKSLAPLYLISGDELLLKQDALQWIRKAAKNAGFCEHLRLSSAAGEDQLYGLLHSISMLSAKRIIEVDCRDHAPNKVSGKILQEYADNPSSDTLLLLDTGKIDAKLAKAAWIKSCEKSGVQVSIWPILRDQLPEWIQARARKYKLQIQPDAARLLADYVEANLIAAAQTIEKLYLLKSQHPIDASLIQSLLTDETCFSIFDFIDSLIAGDKSRTLHILEKLKEEGIEPVLILWGITRELRQLANYTQQLNDGTRMEELFRKERIFSRREAPVRHFLRKFTTVDCHRFLTHAAELDQVIKGAIAGNIWENLQMFCLRCIASSS